MLSHHLAPVAEMCFVNPSTEHSWTHEGWQCTLLKYVFRGAVGCLFCLQFADCFRDPSECVTRAMHRYLNIAQPLVPRGTTDQVRLHATLCMSSRLAARALDAGQACCRSHCMCVAGPAGATEHSLVSNGLVQQPRCVSGLKHSNQGMYKGSGLLAGLERFLYRDLKRRRPACAAIWML